jgi:hypothetical protein
MIVEQTKHRPSAILNEVSQRNRRSDLDGGFFGDHIFVNSMEQILQISGGKLVRSDSACT